MRFRAALLAVVPALTSLPALPASAQETATRHLVYNFTVGIQSDTHATVGSAPQEQKGGAPIRVNDDLPASKTATDTESSGVSSDGGTITVDVFSVQADGGLHVRVSESSHRNTIKPVDCIVYPSTSVDCGTRISSEAALVVSTLSPQFFQPASLDAKNHWSEGANVPGLSLDFTASAPKDSVVWITEERMQKLSSGAGGKLHGTATFTYDTAKRISTDVKDREIIEQGSAGQSSNVTLDITAKLATDSQTAKN